MRFCRARISSVVTAAFMAVAANLPVSAYAQEPAASDQEPEAIDEIVVTAQKREERAQDVPISMAVLGQAVLAEAKVDTVLDIARVAPGFSATRNNQSAGIRMVVRGIGSVSNNGIDPSVATFIDGAYVPRAGSLFAGFMDVGAIEILRGPQGTLFGRNASSGAVSIRTNEPKNSLDWRASAQYGSFGERELQAMVNFPAGDNFAMRLAGRFSTFDGHATTLIDNHRYGERDNSQLRLSFKWNVSDNVSWLLRADHLKVTGDGGFQFEPLPESFTTATLANFRTRLGGVLPDVVDPYDRVSNSRTFGDLDDKQWGLTNKLSWETGGGYTLQLLNAYRHWENTQLDSDVVFTPRDFLYRHGTFESKSHSHELQLISPKDMLDGKLDFVAGLYYSAEDYSIGEVFDLRPQFCTGIVGIAAPMQVAACTASPQVGGSNGQFVQDADNKAIYAQGTFKLADTLDLTLGARHTKDNKSGSFIQTNPNPVMAALFRGTETSILSFDDSQLTYRLNLAYRPNKDVMLFATYSTGYKGGGFNSGGGTPALSAARRTFLSEDVKNYELGVKSTLADGKAVLNATVYRMEFDNFQDRRFDGVSFVIQNAGSLRQQGVETDLSLDVTSAFNVMVSLAYLDSEFTDYRNASGLPGFGGTQDMTGKPNSLSPKLLGNLMAKYDGEFPGTELSWSLSANYNHVAEQYAGGVTDGNPQFIEPSRNLLGARFTLRGANDRWSAELFGNNLTNVGYCNNRGYQPLDNVFGVRNTVTGGSAIVCAVGDPRTWGLKFSVQMK